MKPLRIFVASLFMLCLLAVPQTAKAQSGGSIVVSTQILYDDQTGYVLAEGRAALYTGFAEVLTGGRWQVRLELDGPNGFVGSAPGYMYLNGGSYAYVDTYVDESGYGDYDAYTTVSMMAGAVDYLGFYYFGEWQQGFQQLTVGGGPYYPGMPCYDEWLGFYMNGPCYPEPPAPYLEQPAEIAMSMDSREVLPPPPHIDRIEPSLVAAGASDAKITVYGSHFLEMVDPSLTTRVNLPAGFGAPDTTVADTKIDISVSVTVNAPIGINYLTVSANRQTSNTEPLTVDGPAYLTVVLDARGFVSGTNNIERKITYQVTNYSGTSATGVIPIGEIFTVGSWSCTQPPSMPPLITTPCGSSDAFTTSSGQFTDTWSLDGTNASPTGCGAEGIRDIWRWCAPNNPRTIATLSGWTHTDAVRINGVTSPPNNFSSGTPIYP